MPNLIANTADQTIPQGSTGDARTVTHGKRSDNWVGQPLDHYAIEKWLGGGGMGQVYLARHSWLDIPVAIKIMSSAHEGDQTSLDRFRRESKMAASLDHPNIVRATDGGVSQGSLYLVTEYISGMDLKAFVAENGPMQLERACWAIHEMGKPLNTHTTRASFIATSSRRMSCC